MISEKVVQIELSRITAQDNSRTNMDQTELAELITSMRQSGLLQPVGVIDRKDGTYELVFGHRRVEAAKKLGWQTIGATLQQDDQEEEIIIKNLAENVVRSNLTLIEQGRIVDILKERHGLSNTEIAARLGLSKKKVQTAYEAFREVPQSCRKMIGSATKGTREKGKVSPSVASRIVTVSRRLGIPNTQKEEMFHWVRKDEVTLDRFKMVAAHMSRGLSLKQAKAEADKSSIMYGQFKVNRRTLEKNFPKRKDYWLALHRVLKKHPEFGIEQVVSGSRYEA